MFKVDFMIIGAMKCGTTTLADILAEHPQVCFSSKKEPDFFGKVKDWKTALPEYQKLFNPAKGQVLGEASPNYTAFPMMKGVWDDLYEFNPDLRLIYIMRDPVARILSHYMHNLNRGRHKHESIEQVIFRNPGYIWRTSYYMQIKPFIEKFGRQQVLLLTFEAFMHDKAGIMRQVADFLNIDYEQFGGFENIHGNPSVGKYKLSHKYDFLVNNKLVNYIEPKIPYKLKKSAYQTLTRIAGHKTTEKPRVTEDTKANILNVLELDLQALEKLLGRKPDEWDI